MGAGRPDFRGGKNGLPGRIRDFLRALRVDEYAGGRAVQRRQPAAVHRSRARYLPLASLELGDGTDGKRGARGQFALARALHHADDGGDRTAAAGQDEARRKLRELTRAASNEVTG